MESSGGSCSLPFRIEVAVYALESASNTTTCAPLLAAPALLDARGFRGPQPIEKFRLRGSCEIELLGPHAPNNFLRGASLDPWERVMRRSRVRGPLASIESASYSYSQRASTVPPSLPWNPF